MDSVPAKTGPLSLSEARGLAGDWWRWVNQWKTLDGRVAKDLPAYKTRILQSDLPQVATLFDGLAQAIDNLPAGASHPITIQRMLLNCVNPEHLEQRSFRWALARGVEEYLPDGGKHYEGYLWVWWPRIDAWTNKHKGEEEAKALAWHCLTHGMDLAAKYGTSRWGAWFTKLLERAGRLDEDSRSMQQLAQDWIVQRTQHDYKVGTAETFELLLAQGLRMDWTTENGMTALDMAEACLGFPHNKQEAHKAVTENDVLLDQLLRGGAIWTGPTTALRTAMLEHMGHHPQIVKQRLEAMVTLEPQTTEPQVRASPRL